MKKIILSANVLWTLTNFRKELIKELQNQNYDIICISDIDDLSNDYERDIKKLGVKFYKVKVDRKGINPFADIKYICQLYKIYKFLSPDVVLHFTIKPNIYGTIVCSMMGIPSINTINGLGSGIIKNNFLSKILKEMYKIALDKSFKVFFQNEDDRKFFIQNKLVKKDKTEIVPGSGVDVESFKNCSKINKNKKISYAFIGRLLKDKGIYEYIEAAKIMKQRYMDVEFLLIGQLDNGNLTSVSFDEIVKWKKNKIIKYIGVVDDIKKIFTLCDVVVLPSYREGLSRVLIEAASARKILIASNVPGCKEVVKNYENGYLCKTKDVNSLINAMEKVYNLPYEKKVILQENSYKIAKKYFDKNIVNYIYKKSIQEIFI